MTDRKLAAKKGGKPAKKDSGKSTTPNQGQKKQGGGKKKAAVTTFWTPKTLQRLEHWYDKLKGTENVYSKIASKLGTTRGAVYKKLGRMGKFQAKWLEKE